MPSSALIISLVTALLAGVSVNAERHLVRFENHCGRGTPQLLAGGKVLSSGEDYVSNGPLSAAIAYLQTGECLFNGEKCTTLETTLVNPKVAGGGSSTDVSLIPPHAYNVEASFSYFNGCDGAGALCSGPRCDTAFFVPDDNQVQVQCQTNDVNLLITFCGSAQDSVKGVTPGSKPPVSSQPPPTGPPKPPVSPTTAKPPSSTANPPSPPVSPPKPPPPSSSSSTSLTAVGNAAPSPSASGTTPPRCATKRTVRRRREAAERMRRHHARNAHAVL